jgi:hypothetical protein
MTCTRINAGRQRARALECRYRRGYESRHSSLENMAGKLESSMDIEHRVHFSSNCRSSPDSYISIMMSEPPTNSPPT